MDRCIKRNFQSHIYTTAEKTKSDKDSKNLNSAQFHAEALDDNFQKERFRWWLQAIASLGQLFADRSDYNYLYLASYNRGQ